MKGDLFRHIQRYHRQENIKIEHLNISNQSFRQVPIFEFPKTTINGKPKWKLMPIVKQYYEGISFKTVVGRPNFTFSDLDQNPVSEEYTVEWVEGDLFCSFSPLCNFAVYANNDSSSNGTKLMDRHINSHIVQNFDIPIDANQQRYYNENDLGMNEENDSDNIVNTATPRNAQLLQDMLEEWNDQEDINNAMDTSDDVVNEEEPFDSDYDEDNDPSLMQEEDEDQHDED